MNGFLEKGDLVRMCGMNEPWAVDPDGINWCYGIYMGVRENPTAFMEKQDVVLYKGTPMLFDHFWHKEKIA